MSKLSGWRGEICKSVHTYDGDINAYLCTFLPSQTPYTANITPEVAQMSSAFTAVTGKERESYKPLVRLSTALGLSRLIADGLHRDRRSISS